MHEEEYMNEIIKILALNGANVKIEELIEWMHKKSGNMLTLEEPLH